MCGTEFRALALALDGTLEVPHFERRAFKVRRIFASLAPSEETANLFLTPLEQEHWCGRLPDVFTPLPNNWGARGWTTITLAQIDADGLGPALRGAWVNGGGVDLQG
ncbi:MAG: MmcQ/YjbR family DNA-binding protein [Tabrizicola sp.]|nr:MmcQ/YjbR family DNA-binding protein [Tabrizicola sp.]